MTLLNYTSESSQSNLATTGEKSVSKPDAWILLVDDDSEIRSYMNRCLSDLGFERVEAENGVDALSTIKDRMPATPSLVVTDIVMPLIDGLQLKAALLQSPALSRIPVLLVTGEARQYRHGPALHKPFNSRQFRAAVRAVLDTS